MKRFVFLAIVVMLLLTPHASLAQEPQEVVVPYSVTGWVIDGEVTEAERAAAVEIPLEGLPYLRAWAMHNGKDIYIAFEVLPPWAEGWEEIFIAWDSKGDGRLYSGGDNIGRCFPEGCEHWYYIADLEFDFVADLHSAVSHDPESGSRSNPAAGPLCFPLFPDNCVLE